QTMIDLTFSRCTVRLTRRISASTRRCSQYARTERIAINLLTILDGLPDYIRSQMSNSICPYNCREGCRHGVSDKAEGENPTARCGLHGPEPGRRSVSSPRGDPCRRACGVERAR